MEQRVKVRCMDCGSEWTEIYPEGMEDSTESYSDPEGAEPCDCESDHETLEED